MERPQTRACVAAVAGAKGLGGAVRLKTFTADPAAVAGFAALEDDAGRPVRLTVLERRAGVTIAAIEGVGDRAAAEALRGTRLYVARADLPPAGADEFYHVDLIGLAATLAGGDVIEIRGPGNASVMLPFTRETVPEVALAEGRLTIDPPPGLPGLDALLAAAAP